jgi:hypothetical protein
MPKSGVVWQFAVKTTVGIKNQVTTMLVFYSLFNCCYQILSQTSAVSADKNSTTEMEKHRVEAL